MLDQRAAAGAHEAHFARQDIQQLRQLVHAGAAQDAPDPRHPRVALEMQPVAFAAAAISSARSCSASDTIVLNFHILNSRPKRPTRRWRNSGAPREPAVIANAMPEHQRREHDQRDRSDRDVERPLREAVAPGRRASHSGDQLLGTHAAGSFTGRRGCLPAGRRAKRGLVGVAPS